SVRTPMGTCHSRARCVAGGNRGGRPRVRKAVQPIGSKKAGVERARGVARSSEIRKAPRFWRGASSWGDTGFGACVGRLFSGHGVAGNLAFRLGIIAEALEERRD